MLNAPSTRPNTVSSAGLEDRMLVRSGIVLVLVSLFTVFTGCMRDPDTVAKVGDWELSVDEFRKIVAGRLGGEERAAERDFEAYKEVLDEQVERRMKIIDGYNKGVDTDPSVQEAYQRELGSQAVNKLARAMYEKIITEEMVRDFYDHAGEEVHVSHILIRAGDTRTEEQAKELIQRVRRELDRPGVLFKEVAQKYSEDTTATDGDLGWFGWGVMVPEFQEAAWALQPGEISDPIRSSYGWHVLQLHGRRAIKDRPTFEEDKDRIFQQLGRIHGTAIQDTAITFVEQEKEERGLVMHDHNIEILYDKLTGRNAPSDPFSLLSEEQQNMPLVTLDEGATNFTPEDIRKSFSDARRQGFNLQSIDDLKQLIDGALVRDVILPDAAKEMGYYEDPEVLEAAERVRDSRVYQIISQKMVYDRDEATLEEAKAHFDANPDEYKRPAQHTLIEILVSDERLAERLARRIRGGENMRELAVTYSERRNAKEKEGVLGPITENQYHPIGQRAAEAELGELVGPVKSMGKYSIFKVISREEPAPRPFEQVKNKVRADVQTHKRKQLEETWVDSLRNSIPHWTNDGPLRNLFEEV
ncbi:hypothetical protein GF324_10580 [bacterium]|nr:hypothetical protein [bacterium]